MIEMWISSEMFWDKNERPKFSDRPQELSDLFNHEWGHVWLKSEIQGYSSFSTAVKENMADDIMNFFRNKRGDSNIEYRYRTGFWQSGWGYYKFDFKIPFRR